MRFTTMLIGAALAVLSAGVQADQAGKDWRPNRPVRIIVPIVGSTNDVLARLMAPKLQAAFGQPFVVENKGGAGGNIGAAEVARAAPDGLTLLVGYNGPLAINATLFDSLPYDPRKSFAPITLAVKSPQYLVANPSAGFTSVQDLIAKAKAEPHKYSYGSVSLGSASHLTMEMFKEAAGFQMAHVPYRGAGPALTDLLGGQVQAGFFV
ncbi:MAG: tripartite tricarboxylate transporter substrate binding protein, partial [Proteobacteria bacterium]|nr:tripartite tricarboxylate transporter substrate binding protein [Pseudomonadota bacterium]